MFDIISVRHILILLFPLFLFSCSKSADDTDTFAPTLMESTPANGATSVNINTSISLKFTEQIVLSASGKIRLNDQVVNATVSPRTLTIISSGLQYNTTYTLIIPNQNWIQYAAPFTLGQDWWNNKGIVSLVWHWRDPLTKSGAFYTTDTSFDVSKVNDPNSDEYKAMIVDIDVIAGYLKQFKDAGIPVIWRPLHEAAGGWFWWGAKGPEACKTLWKLMFNRLVTVHGLNNLIWVWTSDTESSALSWYPGDEYVDIIGMDIYPGNNNHASQSDKFNKVNEIFSNKKIIALTECGSVPDPALMKSNGDVWSWFMPWNGDFTESDIHNGATWWNKFFSYDFVITRDQMPDLKN